MPCYYMPMAPKLLEEAYLLISSSKDSWESVNLQINSREEVVLITLGTNWLLSWDVLASWGNSRCFQAYVLNSRYSSNIQSLNPAAVINNHLVNLHERIQLVIQSGNSGKCHVGRWPTKATTSNDGIKDWHTGPYWWNSPSDWFWHVPTYCQWAVGAGSRTENAITSSHCITYYHANIMPYANNCKHFFGCKCDYSIRRNVP